MSARPAQPAAVGGVPPLRTSTTRTTESQRRVRPYFHIPCALHPGRAVNRPFLLGLKRDNSQSSGAEKGEIEEEEDGRGHLSIVHTMGVLIKRDLGGNSRGPNFERPSLGRVDGTRAKKVAQSASLLA